MPRMAVPGFAGPSNVLRSTNQDIEETINRYAETTAPGSGKVRASLLPCPGLVPFGQVSDSPGSTIFQQDGRCFGVTGTSFWEVVSTGATTIYGTVVAATDALPASIVSNGTAGDQLLIVTGGYGYVFTLSTNTLVVINLVNFPTTGFPVGTAQQCEFMDGYGIVLVADSREFQISALEDFTSWDPLDVAQRSEASDNIQTMCRNHREIWFLGTKTGEVWYNSGDPLFPFAPIPGTFIECGSASVSSCRLADTIGWISLDERGNGQVMLAKGYEPVAVSSGAMGRYLQTSTDLAAATVFTQQQEGHLFFWIHVPDLDTTPVYDVTTGIWHKRALWNSTTCVYEPHLASATAFAFNKHLVLDRTSGIIYDLSLTNYDDSVV